MLRVLAINPATAAIGFSRYRTKVLLFYLLWIYAPPYPSRTSPILPSSPHPPSTCTASLFPPSSPPVAVVTRDLPLGATPFSHDADNDAAVPSPLTAAYLSGAPRSSRSATANSVSTSSVAAGNMPARGSTSRGSRASNESGPTPPLSEQPAAESAAADDLATRPQRAAGAAQDSLVDVNDEVSPSRKGRREEPVDDSPTCSTTPPAPPSPRLTPLTYTLFALHLLFLLELVLLNLETSPAMSNLPSALPSPSPPSFSTSHPVRAPTRGRPSPSLAKRLARARWRISATWAACGPELVVWVGVAVVLGAIGATWCTGGGEGWNAVLGPPGWTGHLRLALGEEGRRGGARGWDVMRNVVGLEVAIVVLGLAQSILPLLVPVGLVPSTVPVPSYLEPPPSSPTIPLNDLSSSSRTPLFTIPVLGLTQQYLHPSLSFLLSTLQLAQLALARPPSHSLLNWRTLAWVHATWCAFGGASRTKARTASLVAQVRELAQAFPGPERGADEEWRCSICFEGGGETKVCEEVAACAGGAAVALAGRARVDESRRRVIGFKTLCTLPCRHSFHADCLVRWFRRVAFCPTCHCDARTSSASAQPDIYHTALRALHRTRALTAALDARAPAASTSEDGYPGARAAAARDGMRRRTVDLEGLSAALEAVAMDEAEEGEEGEARAGAQPSELPEVAD
ncbi:hypothetical protein JCM8208_007498 [Rhodotorula glutinis]